MPTLDSWRQRLAGLDNRPAAAQAEFRLPPSPDYYAQHTTLVSTPDEARSMADLAARLPLAWVGLAAAFSHESPAELRGQPDRAGHDPHGIRPEALGLALAEPTGSGGRLHRFAVDLRRADVLPAVSAVLRLPACFVGHGLRDALFCLFRLGLPEPAILWDTRVRERAAALGRSHRRYRLVPRADEATQARAAEEAEAEDSFRLGLAATCQRHGVSHRPPTEDGQTGALMPGHIEAAIVEATAAARLYPLQLAGAARDGTLHHLTTVEMPWVLTNARMAWRGVRVDDEKCRLAESACQRHLAGLIPRLAALGVTSALSQRHLADYFGRLGMLDLFRRGGQIAFDRGTLAAAADRHPAVPLIHAVRRVLDLQGEHVLTGSRAGSDGRVHPQHHQLGTHSGRQTCRSPNLLGLGRVFRPLVVPEPGRGIGEVDLCQIEVGVAAAVYGDGRLVEMFNSGDVYSAMARDFFRDELMPDDLALPWDQFKKRHGKLRERMKACTLGIVYGLTPHGLALQLGAGRRQAAQLHERFLALFPALRKAMAEGALFGELRGYASTSSGLRRYRALAGRPLSAWERNWMANHPVQGSAAVAFKSAGNRLDRLYRAHDAWLILAVHDAFVFEAPLGCLTEVAELTRRVLCEAVQEHFPALRPRAEVNIAHPGCWNKDGHADALDRWLDDPTYTF